MARKRDKKKASTAVAALGEKGVFTEGGKYAGKVQLTRSVSLAEGAAGKNGKISTRITKSAEEFSPSGRAAERAEEKEKGPQLGKKLAALAAGIQPGKTAIGAAVSGGLSGAAIGATIGEEIGAAKRRRDKKRKKDEQF